MDKRLIILKATSGTGKTTFAKFLVNNIPNSTYVEADMFMTDAKGEYLFDAKRLNYCHTACRNGVEFAMMNNKSTIILSNTSTTIKEVQPYLDLAAKYNYQVVSLVMEKYHQNKDLHSVPELTLAAQEKRLKESLKLR